MITHVLVGMSHDPTFIIGGILNNYKTNARAGGGRYAVAEVDESDKSHLNLRPNHVVVNNLEVDHLNFYKDHGEIIATMKTFLSQNSDLKTLLSMAQMRAVWRFVMRPASAKILTFSADANRPADYAATEIVDCGDRLYV